MDIPALDRVLDTLAEFESDSNKVVSLYLDYRPDRRATIKTFVESAAKEQRGEVDESVIEELVTLAHRTDADVTFIEEAQLLEDAKGVGATLRFRV
jgi:peptide subunit release factor 1 (eRF1)